jgi:hypothetical protein
MQFSGRAVYLSRSGDAIEDSCTGRWLGCAAPQVCFSLLARARVRATPNDL